MKRSGDTLFCSGAVLLLFLAVGCSDEAADSVMLKNVLIGTLIGACLPFILFGIGLLFSRKSADPTGLDEQRRDT
jgi:hypothetical protein